MRATVTMAASRAHVCLVEAPGFFELRVSAERALLARGWVLASSPADADVLMVCGAATDELPDALGAVWEAMPGPRVRVEVNDQNEIPSALQIAHAQLVDNDLHGRDARTRSVSGMDHETMDHQHRDHGDMDMAPGGIPLAEGEEDRDGLEMDVLHLPLGPVLAHWPPGLVLRCVLHGDVVTKAEVEATGLQGAASSAAPGVRAARRCDCVVDLLALAGWQVGENLARRARDASLDGDVEIVGGMLVVLRRKLGRSWVLRWMLRDIGRVTAEDVSSIGLPAYVTGDVYDRLLAVLDLAQEELAGGSGPRATGEAVLGALPAMVEGLDLASVRLVVASLDLPSVLILAEDSHA